MSRVALVLASASPARLAVLRHAGIEPVVVVSRVDESAITVSEPALLAQTLARLKGEEVAARLPEDPAHDRTLLVACDSVLDVDGVGFGKPGDATAATTRLRQLRGRSAVLHTGHYLLDLRTFESQEATASTTVRFGWFGDEEIDAYVATGEPLQVAGSFTIDGLGGAFVDGIDGDPSNVVGISLPLLRSLVTQTGVGWHQLWNRGTR
jgi:septum formation protein